MLDDDKLDGFEVDTPNLELDKTALNEMGKYTIRGLSRLAAGRTQRAKIVGGLLTGIILLFVSLFAMTSVLEKENKFMVQASSPENVGIALSEIGNFVDEEYYSSMLQTEDMPSMFNIDGEKEISPDIYLTQGTASGDNYIAYSFYLKNMSTGNTIVEINNYINIEVNSLGMDTAVRVRIYKTVYSDGNIEDTSVQPTVTTYAKSKTDGSLELVTGSKYKNDTVYATDFYSDSQVMNETFELDTTAIVKYTIVLWLEGWDDECVNSVIGGSFGISTHYDVTN